MTTNQAYAGNRTYLATWAALLFLTVGMLVTGYITLSRAAIIIVLVVAMLAKATLIGSYFMHLRFEHKGLILIVAISLLATAAVMFGIMALDGLHVFNSLAD